MQEHTWSEMEDKGVSSSKFCQYTWALKVMLDMWGISGMGKCNRCRMGEGVIMRAMRRGRKETNRIIGQRRHRDVESGCDRTCGVVHNIGI